MALPRQNGSFVNNATSSTAASLQRNYLVNKSYSSKRNVANTTPVRLCRYLDSTAIFSMSLSRRYCFFVRSLLGWSPQPWGHINIIQRTTKNIFKLLIQIKLVLYVLFSLFYNNNKRNLPNYSNVCYSLCFALFNINSDQISPMCANLAVFQYSKLITPKFVQCGLFSLFYDVQNKSRPN